MRPPRFGQLLWLVANDCCDTRFEILERFDLSLHRHTTSERELCTVTPRTTSNNCYFYNREFVHVCESITALNAFLTLFACVLCLNQQQLPPIRLRAVAVSRTTLTEVVSNRLDKTNRPYVASMDGRRATLLFHSNWEFGVLERHTPPEKRTGRRCD